MLQQLQCFCVNFEAARRKGRTVFFCVTCTQRIFSREDMKNQRTECVWLACLRLLVFI